MGSGNGLLKEVGSVSALISSKIVDIPVSDSYTRVLLVGQAGAEDGDLLGHLLPPAPGLSLRGEGERVGGLSRLFAPGDQVVSEEN